MPIIDFQKLLEENIYLTDTKLTKPIDWDTSLYTSARILGIMRNKLLIFKKETINESSILGCFIDDSKAKIPISNQQIYTAFSEVISNKDSIELLYYLLDKNDNLYSFNNLKQDLTCRDYLNSVAAGSFTYIKFHVDIQLSDIYKEFIFYCLDEQYSHTILEKDRLCIEQIKNAIVKLNGEHFTAIVDFFNCNNIIHTFGDLYAYVEHFCDPKWNDILRNICPECKATIRTCSECNNKLENVGIEWKTIKNIIKNGCSKFEIKLDDDYKFYGSLKEKRNSIFHHKQDMAENIKKISNTFSMHIYSLIFSLLLFIDNKE